MLGGVPLYHRCYSPGQLQFLTTSTYRRAPLFFAERFCRCFVERLEEVRQELKFLLIGWVVMPEHFHLLLLPQPALRRRFATSQTSKGGGLRQPAAFARFETRKGRK